MQFTGAASIRTRAEDLPTEIRITSRAGMRTSFCVTDAICVCSVLRGNIRGRLYLSSTFVDGMTLFPERISDPVNLTTTWTVQIVNEYYIFELNVLPVRLQIVAIKQRTYVRALYFYDIPN